MFDNGWFWGAPSCSKLHHSRLGSLTGHTRAILTACTMHWPPYRGHCWNVGAVQGQEEGIVHSQCQRYVNDVNTLCTVCSKVQPSLRKIAFQFQFFVCAWVLNVAFVYLYLYTYIFCVVHWECINSAAAPQGLLWERSHRWFDCSRLDRVSRKYKITEKCIFIKSEVSLVI